MATAQQTIKAYWRGDLVQLYRWLTGGYGRLLRTDDSSGDIWNTTYQYLGMVKKKIYRSHKLIILVSEASSYLIFIYCHFKFSSELLNENKHFFRSIALIFKQTSLKLLFCIFIRPVIGRKIAIYAIGTLQITS